MRLRRGADTIAQMRAARRGACPTENELRAVRLRESAPTDCAARVADVLKKLGYGFAVIPHDRPKPKRA